MLDSRLGSSRRSQEPKLPDARYKIMHQHTQFDNHSTTFHSISSILFPTHTASKSGDSTMPKTAKRTTPAGLEPALPKEIDF